jgi:TP901 family phage tail tape measure protein
MSNREIEARLKISAIDRTGKVLSNIGNKLEMVNRRAVMFNRTQQAVSDSLLLMARYVGPAALGLELYRATTKAANFETSLFNIQKKSNATTEQMKLLGEQARQLSREMPLSIDEIAAGMERGAAAGVPTDQLREFARLTAMIADGWEVSSEEAGNFVAGFNKGLHIPMEQMQTFASLINDLADSGIADEKDIADFIDRVGASLQNFGMTPQQVAAYGASFLNLKMPAEVAARAMNTLSSKLIAPENLAPKSRKALTAIVGDLKSFAKLSGDEKMSRFLRSLHNMPNQRRASLLGALLGEGFSDEILRLVNGLDEVDRNMGMVRKQMEHPSNSILTLYEKQLETFNQRVKILRNQLGDIELSLGQRILPLAEKVVGTVSKGLKAQDEYDAGRPADNKIALSERDEFRQRLRDAGLYRGDDMLLWRARREAGKDPTQKLTVFKWLDNYMRDKVYGGNLSGGPKRRFSGRYVPHDLLGADAPKYSLDNPPLPENRPTKQQLADFKLQQAYMQGQNFGRDFVDKAQAAVKDKQYLINAKERVEDGRRRQSTLDEARRRVVKMAIADRLGAFQSRKDGDVPSQPTANTGDRGAKATYLADALFAPVQESAGTLSTALESGSQKIEQGGVNFLQSVERAAEAIASAGQQLVTQLANLKVNVNPVGAAPSKVNANTGRTNTFANAPASLGHQ